MSHALILGGLAVHGQIRNKARSCDQCSKIQMSGNHLEIKNLPNDSSHLKNSSGRHITFFNGH
jgi:hypothetical protein